MNVFKAWTIQQPLDNIVQMGSGFVERVQKHITWSFQHIISSRPFLIWILNSFRNKSLKIYKSLTVTLITNSMEQLHMLWNVHSLVVLTSSNELWWLLLFAHIQFYPGSSLQGTMFTFLHLKTQPKVLILPPLGWAGGIVIVRTHNRRSDTSWWSEPGAVPGDVAAPTTLVAALGACCRTVFYHMANLVIKPYFQSRPNISPPW